MRAAMSPSALAITAPDQNLSYAELLRRADHIARMLLENGIGPAATVAVCLPREPLLVVALLGVLRAGCSYLPLDLEYPADRLRFMLEDSGAAAVIGGPASREWLPGPSVRLIDVTGPAPRDDPLAAGLPTTGLPTTGLPTTGLPTTGPADLAYVIYTSGSTGTPKGVAVEHRNVTALFDSVGQCIPLRESDTWSWFHSVAFDVSAWEIWGALLSGAQIAIAGARERYDPDAFFDFLRRNLVTMLSQTPSAFRRLIPMFEAPGAQHSVRIVMLAGEPVNVNEFDKMLESGLPNCPRIFNLYGNTETTIHSTIKELTRNDLSGGVLSPIGVPLEHAHALVLDEQRHAIPAGQHGELWIGGDGVARGYVNRPELTAERFVTGLLPEFGQVRWYRTGDIVRQLPTGELDFIGRRDRQVKIRGFRVELGEVETVFLGHPKVAAAAVELTSSGEPHDRSGPVLAAYLVLKPGEQPTAYALRGWLSERLPAYMVPPAIGVVEELPITPNGKVDRAALARLMARPLPGHQAQEPSTELEKRLHPIWLDVLATPLIGRHDNFFVLGGDSMRALRLVGDCKATGISATVQMLYERPTLAEFAAAVESGGPLGRDQAAAPPARGQPADGAPDSEPGPGGHIEYFPATQMQCGIIFESEFRRHDATYQVVSAAQISGIRHSGRPDVLAALQDVAGRNAVLRASFDLTSFDRPMQKVYSDAFVQLHYEDVSELNDNARRQRIDDVHAEARHYYFRWTDCPLWRVACLKISADTLQLFIAHHHAILDGWSVACFCDQLWAALNEIPYRTAAMTVNEQAVILESEAIRSAESSQFWRSQVDAWEPLPVPSRAPEPAEPALCSAKAPLDAHLRAGVLRAARTWNCSVKHVHLAAHLKSLEQFAGWQRYAATGLSVNARPEERHAENALGMFVNAVPFAVTDLGSDWRELTGVVMGMEADLQPHRWFPLAAMMSRFGMPSLSVAFNYTEFSSAARQKYLKSIASEVVTQMPLTVSVGEDELVVEGLTRHFPASDCTRLLQSHLTLLNDAITEATGRHDGPWPPPATP